MMVAKKRAGVRLAWLPLLAGVALSAPAPAATNTPAEIVNEHLVVDF